MDHIQELMNELNNVNHLQFFKMFGTELINMTKYPLTESLIERLSWFNDLHNSENQSTETHPSSS